MTSPETSYKSAISLYHQPTPNPQLLICRHPRAADARPSHCRQLAVNHLDDFTNNFIRVPAILVDHNPKPQPLTPNTLPGGVVSLQPAAQTIQTRHQNSLGDVCLIKLVTHFPFQPGGDYYPPAQFRMLFEPSIQSRSGARHHREQCKLIYDSVVERRRLEEHNELIRE